MKVRREEVDGEDGKDGKVGVGFRANRVPRTLYVPELSVKRSTKGLTEF